jgi:uncharacterized membrane protein
MLAYKLAAAVCAKVIVYTLAFSRFWLLGHHGNGGNGCLWVPSLCLISSFVLFVFSLFIILRRSPPKHEVSGNRKGCFER